MVAAYTDERRENDLGDSKTVWRVALETGGQEAPPLRIEKIGRPNENLRELYPYMDFHFTLVYRLHFPKVAQAPAVLRIASGVGMAELTFEQL